MNLTNLVAPSLGDAPGGKAGAEPFELRHDLEHLDQRLRLDAANRCALPPAQLDQVVGGHQAERLPHRRARDPETLGDLLLVEPAARFEMPRRDRPFELLAQALGERYAGARHQGFVPIFHAPASAMCTNIRHHVSPISAYVYKIAASPQRNSPFPSWTRTTRTHSLQRLASLMPDLP